MPTLDMPTHCPITGEPLLVTRLECPESEVRIEGHFRPNEFALLADEHLDFMRLFVKVRGNLKEVERIMGVSYPTVRLRFDNMLKTLGYDVPEPPKNDRSEIIGLLEQGEITAEEATRRLNGLRQK